MSFGCEISHDGARHAQVRARFFSEFFEKFLIFYIFSRKTGACEPGLRFEFPFKYLLIKSLGHT